MVVVNPNDIAFSKLGDDSVGKAFVDGDVLLVGGRFVKVFGFRGIWNCIVKAGPENLEETLE